MSFQIIDNGQGIGEEAVIRITQSHEQYKTSKHMGIMNVDRKIKLCCGEHCGILIDSRIGMGTKVTITLDYRTQ